MHRKGSKEARQEGSNLLPSRREEIDRTLCCEILVAQRACLRNAGTGSGDKKPE